MQVRLASFEDGIDNLGFRKASAFIKSIHSDTKVAYIPTGNRQGLVRVLAQKQGGQLPEEDIHISSEFLAQGDIVGISAMTQYSSTVHKVIKHIRRLNPRAYIIWGGIHPIVQPEDAIEHADAACTGEGEFAFKGFLELFKDGKDYSTSPGFWFREGSSVIKNTNLPLMQQEEMDKLPSPTYQDGELIYHYGEGFKPINSNDFFKYSSLCYNTVWSIGCPFKCTYCGNSKFVDNDDAYRKLRHSSPNIIIEEIKRAVSKHPYISAINFFDDSVLALPFKVLEEFAKLYKAEINIPFALGGVIPNYCRENKLALLVDAGLNRVGMGIESGSQDILDFYKRPTKLHHIKDAARIFNNFRKYMIPPSYDMILENPIETVEDVRATLDLIYELPRPFTLNVFALRAIPNTQLARDIEERGVTVPPIDKNYTVGFHSTLGNILVYALVIWKIPKWLFNILRNKSYPVHYKQPSYPFLFKVIYTAYLVKRGLSHLRFMDFSIIGGQVTYFLWKFGIISFWQRFILKRYHLSNNNPKVLESV